MEKHEIFLKLPENVSAKSIQKQQWTGKVSFLLL